MNLNDTGYLVQYIYALLQDSSAFQRTYHINNTYTAECHQLLCEYYKSLAYGGNAINSVYENILSMFNLWTGLYYDEGNGFKLFTEDSYSSTSYRCFIIPVSHQDSLLDSNRKLYTSVNTSDKMVPIYRYTNRSSVYKILTDSTDKSSGSGVWSEISEIPSDYSVSCGTILADFPESNDSTYLSSSSNWKYLIIGIPLPCDVSKIMVSHFGDTSILVKVIDAFSENPWAVNDEFIPYLLDRCITPNSPMDEIWYLQKELADIAAYTSNSPGVWDDKLTSLLKSVQSGLSDSAQDLYNYGYLTPSTESAIEMTAASMGRRTNYYE